MQPTSKKKWGLRSVRGTFQVVQLNKFHCKLLYAFYIKAKALDASPKIKIDGLQEWGDKSRDGVITSLIANICDVP